MLKVEQILRNEEGINVLGDSFESIVVRGTYIIVKKNGLFGAFDANSYKKLFDCEWDKIIFDRDYFIVSRNDFYTVFDSKGNQILGLDWSKIALYNTGILVAKNNKQGFYDYNGNVILNCEWKRIEPYSQLLFAYTGNGSKGIKFDYSGNKTEE